MSDDRWYVLHHRPGPAVPEGTSLFAHPRFPEHVGFLQGLLERGWLVGAGPTVPEEGRGMAVLRIPEGADVDVVALATTEDPCVLAGVLEVDVVPWQVRFGA